MDRHQQRLCAWIAILAILAATLLPSAGRATDLGENDLLHDICFSSSTGLSMVELDSGEFDAAARFGSDGTPQPIVGLDHCPFCCGHPLLAVLPAKPPTIPLRIVEASLFPSLYLVAPRPLFAWSPSLARAPPVVS